MNRIVTLVIAKAVLGAGLALGFLTTPHGAAAHADTIDHYDAYAAEVGDDNADVVIMEDESGWDCATMGNRICGSGAAAVGDLIYCPRDGVWSTK